MNQELISIWENLDPKSFSIKLKNKSFKKSDIDNLKNKLKKNFTSLTEFKGKKVFFDIKDRLTFITAFLSLLELKAKIILIPTEIKTEDYLDSGGVFLSDNKEVPEGIFIKDFHLVNAGSNFKDIENQEIETDNSVLYLYTSGSTGKAKLIQKSSINLLSELNELSKILKLSKNDVFFFTPPLYHIYGLLFGFLLPVFNSCRIIIDYLFTPETIADFIKANNVSFFVSIPTYYRMFGDLNLISVFSKCKFLTSSSAPLPLDISRDFLDKKVKILEVYGSTETGGIAHRIGAESLEWKLFSYVKIIEEWDDYLETETINETKVVEFRITSPAISVKYDNQNGYNTGDLVELHPNGSFLLLGRNTRFVKINGKRVDLLYIGNKILEFLSLKFDKKIPEDFIYIGFKDNMIYAIIDIEVRINSKVFKNDLKKHLPSYAIPRIILNCKIPRNSMGKLNKLAINELIEKENKK
ncbi:MAG: AMP-binding protein [Spirochaetes bacterium]|nr:AMP-binding protein [Spirochaetota bacterium]